MYSEALESFLVINLLEHVLPVNRLASFLLNSRSNAKWDCYSILQMWKLKLRPEGDSTEFSLTN